MSSSSACPPAFCKSLYEGKSALSAFKKRPISGSTLAAVVPAARRLQHPTGGVLNAARGTSPSRALAGSGVLHVGGKNTCYLNQPSTTTAALPLRAGDDSTLKEKNSAITVATMLCIAPPPGFEPIFHPLPQCCRRAAALPMNQSIEVPAITNHLLQKLYSDAVKQRRAMPTVSVPETASPTSDETVSISRRLSHLTLGDFLRPALWQISKKPRLPRNLKPVVSEATTRDAANAAPKQKNITLESSIVCVKQTTVGRRPTVNVHLGLRPTVDKMIAKAGAVAEKVRLRAGGQEPQEAVTPPVKKTSQPAPPQVRRRSRLTTDASPPAAEATTPPVQRSRAPVLPKPSKEKTDQPRTSSAERTGSVSPASRSGRAAPTRPAASAETLASVTHAEDDQTEEDAQAKTPPARAAAVAKVTPTNRWGPGKKIIVRNDTLVEENNSSDWSDSKKPRERKASTTPPPPAKRAAAPPPLPASHSATPVARQPKPLGMATPPTPPTTTPRAQPRRMPVRSPSASPRPRPDLARLPPSTPARVSPPAAGRRQRLKKRIQAVGSCIAKKARALTGRLYGGRSSSDEATDESTTNDEPRAYDSLDDSSDEEDGHDLFLDGPLPAIPRNAAANQHHADSSDEQPEEHAAPALQHTVAKRQASGASRKRKNPPSSSEDDELDGAPQPPPKIHRQPVPPAPLPAAPVALLPPAQMPPPKRRRQPRNAAYWAARDVIAAAAKAAKEAERRSEREREARNRRLRREQLDDDRRIIALLERAAPTPATLEGIAEHHIDRLQLAIEAATCIERCAVLARLRTGYRNLLAAVNKGTTSPMDAKAKLQAFKQRLAVLRVP